MTQVTLPQADAGTQQYTLRPYQQEAVDRVVTFFKEDARAAVIVLPTGAGKSLVIAELARIARGNILVLAHVKELVEQNCGKYESYGQRASLFSAGLGSKDASEAVTFGSVQSVAKNLDAFPHRFSLLIIDECHRVSQDDNSEYQQIIRQLSKQNPHLRVLGLTATPYRLDTGWIYQRHIGENAVRSVETKPFYACLFELPLRHMVDEGYLTPANVLDAPVALYDFERLRHPTSRVLAEADINAMLSGATRATKRIVAQIVQSAEDRQGVMIFAATVLHAKEIVSYLPAENTALILGEMKAKARDSVITAFKAKQIKFLVNVAVLTTGFDAPHVDLIAILRPTESVGLYQQIVGRGLRLSEGKNDCLVLDYAGNNHDLYRPHIAEKKPNSNSVVVEIACPACTHINQFWGIKDDNGYIIEHYGRRCQGLVEDLQEYEGNQQALIQCDHRWKFKVCGHCGQQNDIAARQCQHCHEILVDPDVQLKKALALKDCMVLRCAGMALDEVLIKGNKRLQVTYHDEDGAEMKEFFGYENSGQQHAFYHQFTQYHLADRSTPLRVSDITDIVRAASRFRCPDFVIGRKGKKDRFWSITEKIFDYEGRYRRANELV